MAAIRAMCVCAHARMVSVHMKSRLVRQAARERLTGIFLSDHTASLILQFTRISEIIAVEHSITYRVFRLTLILIIIDCLLC